MREVDRSRLQWIAALLGAALLYWALACLARAVPGPAGFDVTVRDAKGALVSHRRMAYVLSPDVLEAPPPGGSLVAVGTFLAREGGDWEWQFGSTSQALLAIDGDYRAHPTGGKLLKQVHRIEAGLHAIEARLERADVEGAIVLGVKPPSERWRAHYVGPGDVVAIPRAEVEARLGRHAALWLRALPVVPALGTALVIGTVVIMMGSRRRRALTARLRELAADPAARSAATGIAFFVIVYPMVSPLFTPGFYACHEEESYIVRLFEYDVAIRGGVPMGRWWPDPIFGRGYPFLCLYAPLLYLLATPFLLLGTSCVATVKIVSGLIFPVGALGVLGLARRYASRPAALVAVALFVYAPYLQTDLWLRADVPESLGFATFPLALFALDRALDRRDPDRAKDSRDVALLALAAAALGCCHNITAYFSVYFLVAWSLCRLLLGSVDRHGLLRAVAGGGLGLLLTVFYAIPAIIDKGHVHIERVLSGWYYAPNHFAPWSTVFYATPQYGMRTHLGFAATIACAGGLAALLSRRGLPLRGPRVTARGFALLAIVGVTLALLLATRQVGLPVVQYVPLAKYVQFPWRMFLFGACLAPLAAPPFIDLLIPPGRDGRARLAFSAIAIGAIMALHLPMYGPSDVLLRKHLHVERFLRGLSFDYVTSINEYLPSTVQIAVADFAPVLRADPASTVIEATSRAPGRYEARVIAGVPATLVFNAHWFPGWRATLDGDDIAIGPKGAAPIDGGGLIRVPVTPGRHTVTLQYGRTALRVACDVISAVALAVALGLLALGLKRRRRAQGHSLSSANESIS